jgi:GT2 family glycosyltransferase/glycosyltransferase involved in cell wall biosynthesis
MQDMRGGAGQAIKHGLAAFADGDGPGAEAWFDRAHRILPKDPTAALLLASSRSRRAPAEADILLRGLLDQHPEFGAAKIALAAIRLALDDAGEAATLLHAHLSAAAPPSDDAFSRLACTIASRANLPGWIGVACDGSVSGSERDCASVDFALDGKPCSVQTPRASRTLKLPVAWLKANSLTAMMRGTHLLGSPIDLRTRRAVSGMVKIDANGDLRGWAWMPADPTIAPRLRISAAKRQTALAVTATDGNAVEALSDGVARPRQFHVPSARLPRGGKLRVTGPDGHDLLGSPLAPAIERNAACLAARGMAAALQTSGAKTRPAAAIPDIMRPLPIDILPALGGKLPVSRTNVPARKPVDVIIPVFRGADELASCLHSVLRDLPANSRIVLVDDGSRDPALRATLKNLDDPRITILRRGRNDGFPAAANTGLRYAAAAPDAPRDAVLLNPDTQVSAGWLGRLARAAYARADIGSVTPLTNDGTLTSYPNAAAPAVLEDITAIDRLGAHCAAANPGVFIELPTAIGFCMFIRHDCLAQVGLFREDLFAQGYGEETDWSLRARHLGWRHVADASTFVAHAGGSSFGPAGRALRDRNMVLLERLHPGANQALQSFIADDALRPARRRVDERRWRDGTAANGAVIMITHAQGGGVRRLVTDRAKSWQAASVRPIILQPHGAWPPLPGEPRRCVLADGAAVYENLLFDPARELDVLAAFLAPDRPRAVELHQMMGHDEALAGLSARLGVPLDIHVHDYALICPRVTLVNGSGRYCGEPQDPGACDDCVSDHGDRLHEGLGASAVRARSIDLVSRARHVHTATAEAARRIARYLPAAGKTIVAPREDETTLPAIAAPRTTQRGRRICVPGAIGDDKGFRLLLACAQDAARRGLDLHFTVVGHTRDDARLMDTGRVFVTGKYADDEAVALIAAHRPDIGFLPSIWPETWCYSLTLLWRAGLWPVAFDLGAQAERITARGAGTLLPAGLPAARINEVFGAFRRPCAA